MIILVSCLLAAYLIGGIPWSYLIARVFKGVDIRTVGSGNVGATNACRLFNKPWKPVAFLGCFLLDAAKGYFPAFHFGGIVNNGILSGWNLSTCVLLIGLAAVVGHVYTPFLRFKGGKGVATSLGVFLAAAPVPMSIAAGIGLVVIFATGYVSVGSIAIGVALPASILILIPGEKALFALALIAGAFIIFKHRTNIVRLARGEEPRIYAGKSGDPPSA
jgi:glycerol-3-phosphate acyltransferase PlsY